MALDYYIVRLWSEDLEHRGESAFNQLVRFNEAIDQALTESVKLFSQRIDESRELFLGILGHDIRTPLGAISMSAQYLLNDDTLSSTHIKVASRIQNGARRIDKMLCDLLDVTRIRLGGSLSLQKQEGDVQGHLPASGGGGGCFAPRAPNYPESSWRSERRMGQRPVGTGALQPLE